MSDQAADRGHRVQVTRSVYRGPEPLSIEGRRVADVVIVGTGGMGREALAWVVDCGHGDDVVGFLDAEVARHGSVIADLPVVGGLEWCRQRPDIQVVIAVGAPAARAQIADQLAAWGVKLATVVHPTAVVGPRVAIGEGSIVCPGVILTCDIAVGHAVILNYGAMVGHDGRIGDAAFIAPGVNLAGAVTVEAGADVGIGATVIQGITIGERAVVGAGAVVIRDVTAGSTVVGVPARPIRQAA